jgi:hypothetical protein
MFGLSYLLGRSGPAARRPALPQTRVHAQPNLEELERRDVPAPMVIGPTALTGTLAVQNPSLNGAQGQLFNAQPGQNASLNATQTQGTNASTAVGMGVFQSLGTTGLTGASTSGFPVGAGTAFGPAISLAAGALASAPFSAGQPPTAATPFDLSGGIQTSPGQSFTVGYAGGPFLTNGSTGPLPGGAPNPVRTGPVTPLTLGAFASLPGTSPYTVEDIRLTGGGGGPTVPLNRPTDGWNPNDPQTRVLIVDNNAGGDAAADRAVLEEAVFQLTAPGRGPTDATPAAAPVVGEP